MRLVETAVLTLVPQTAAHAAAMFAVLSDPAIYRCENAASPRQHAARAVEDGELLMLREAGPERRALA